MRRIIIFKALLTLFLFSSCQTGPGRAALGGRIKGLPAGISGTTSVPFRIHLPRTVIMEQPAGNRFFPVSEELVESILAQLSIGQKIGQRFISWIPGTVLTERAQVLIREGYVAGIILSRQNIVGSEQVRRLTSDLQQFVHNNSPQLGLLIGIDQEGGRVNRLKFKQMTRFPPPFYLGKYQNPNYIEAVAYITAREVQSLGFNMNFAPVLDLYDKPDASIIGDRSLGGDAWLVGELGNAYILGARRAGIASVVKHFPGHGRTNVDSHFSLPVVDEDRNALISKDIFPFQSAVENGVDAIMTAHILYPQLDPEFPATLSERILKDLLRKKMGFEGVVISDDIAMGALTQNFSMPDILKYCFKAGVDLILVKSGHNIIELKGTVLDLYQAGEIALEEIEEGVKRVLRLKIKYGLLQD